jgi:hypothetical protein
MVGVRRISVLVVLLLALSACGSTGTHSLSTPTTTSSPSTLSSPTTQAKSPEVSCGRFATAVTTDRARYHPGQTVVITVSRTNEGGSCHGPGTSTCGGGAFATNRVGQTVWNSGAGPDAPVAAFSCPVTPSPTPATVYPAGTSQVARFQWDQDRCSFEPSGSVQPTVPNPNCPRTQVPAGVYSIGVTGIYGAAGRVLITLTT